MGFLTPAASGEAAVLKTYALQQLAQARSTVYGLTDDQLHATPSASGLSLGALLRHCGQVAVEWSERAAAAPDALPDPPAAPEGLGEFESIEGCQAHFDSIADALAYFDRCVAYASDRFDAVRDLSTPVPVPPAPWYPPSLKSWEARWALFHISTEVARHVGHADIIRESLDGKGSYELNARADGELADDEPFTPYEG